MIYTGSSRNIPGSSKNIMMAYSHGHPNNYNSNSNGNYDGGYGQLLDHLVILTGDLQELKLEQEQNSKPTNGSNNNKTNIISPNTLNVTNSNFPNKHRNSFIQK